MYVCVNQPQNQAALMSNAAISEGERAISDREWGTFTTLLGTVLPQPVYFDAHKKQPVLARTIPKPGQGSPYSFKTVEPPLPTPSQPVSF